MLSAMRKERLTIRLTPSEKRAILAAARSSGMSPGEWLRRSLLTRARAGGPKRKSPVARPRLEASPADIQALENLTARTVKSFARANRRLTLAFAEIAATRRVLAGRHRR